MMGKFFRWLWRAACKLVKALLRGAVRGAETGAEVYVARRFERYAAA